MSKMKLKNWHRAEDTNMFYVREPNPKLINQSLSEWDNEQQDTLISLALIIEEEK